MFRHSLAISSLQISKFIGGSAHSMSLSNAIQAAKVRSDGRAIRKSEIPDSKLHRQMSFPKSGDCHCELACVTPRRRLSGNRDIDPQRLVLARPHIERASRKAGARELGNDLAAHIFTRELHWGDRPSVDRIDKGDQGIGPPAWLLC